MRAPNEIRGIARTVIEATSPALQPVVALRRFVVKSRIDVVMSPFVDLRGKPSAANPTGSQGTVEGPGRPDARRERGSTVNGGSRRGAAS